MRSVSEMLRRFGAPAIALAIILAAAAGVAFAAQTPLTVTTLSGPYVTGQPGAGSLSVTMAACDNVNGNSFQITGREVLLVQNTSTMTAYTFTVTSVADERGRTQDVTAYSVAASTLAAYNFRGGNTGFQQGDGTVHLTCSNAALSFGVLRPAV